MSKRSISIAIIAFVGVVICVVIGIVIVRIVTQVFHGSDLCRYEDRTLSKKLIDDHVLIVVDQSEGLSSSHKRQLRERLLDYISDDKQLPIHSLVMLYGFGKNDFLPGGVGQSIEPRSRVCKPASSGNAVYEGKRRIEKNFHLKFLVPMYSALDESFSISLGERSPILEMLQYLSRTQDVTDRAGKVSSKTLILVSDGLQHSSSFSQYTGDTYADFMSKKGATLKADFRGWTVHIFYLQRYGKDELLQNQKHLEFWMRYFRDSGAHLSRVDRLP